MSLMANRMCLILIEASIRVIFGSENYWLNVQSCIVLICIYLIYKIVKNKQFNSIPNIPE